MKIVLGLFLIIILMSCNNNNEQVQDTNNISGNVNYEKLLSKYKEIPMDTLKVYSPEELTGEFKGVELDSADVVLFPKEIAEFHFHEPPGLFAVYKIKLDEKTIGLITRTPGEYVPSSIKMFLFNIEQNKIESYLELADVWGDAGDYVRKDSWLLQDKDKQLKVFMRVLETHAKSVEDEKDTTVIEKNYYYLMRFNQKKVDTISKDESYLKKVYGELAKVD